MRKSGDSLSDQSNPRWEVMCDEDVTTGYMLATPDVPDNADLRLALFVLLARREWEYIYDPCKLAMSAEPRGFKWTGDDPDEDCAVPVEGDEEPTAGVFWVVDGLDDAEVDRCPLTSAHHQATERP